MAHFLFDLDGVFIRSRNESGEILWGKNIKEDLRIEPSVIREIFIDERWRQALTGNADVRDLITDVFSRHDVSFGADGFLSYWFTQDRRWYPAVLQVAFDLKGAGHSIFLATNQEQGRRHFIASQGEICGLFENIFASADIGVCKPSIDFYRTVCAREPRLNEGKTIVIDDDSRNIASAVEAGLRGICFNPDQIPSHTPEWLTTEIERALKETVSTRG